MIVREVNLAMLVVKRCFTFLIPAMEGRGIMELSLRMRSGEAVEGGIEPRNICTLRRPPSH